MFQHLQEDDLSNPGDWDEFDKARPMDKGAGENLSDAKDNPENNSDNESSRNHKNIKKDVQNQIQESNTQMSFKVKFFVLGFLICIFFVLC